MKMKAARVAVETLKFMPIKVMGAFSKAGTCAVGAVGRIRTLRDKAAFSLLMLALAHGVLWPMLVHAEATGAATGAIGDVIDTVTDFLGIMGGVMIGFGALKIGTGIYSDNADDKQKGIMACVGGAIVAGGAFAFAAVVT